MRRRTSARAMSLMLMGQRQMRGMARWRRCQVRTMVWTGRRARRQTATTARGYGVSDAYEDAKWGYDDDEYSGDAGDGVLEEKGAPLTPPPASPSSEWITNSRGRGRARGRTSRETSSQLAEGAWHEEQKLRISVRRLSACGPELADRTSCRSAVL